jgi:signal transduction histidine kinase
VTRLIRDLLTLSHVENIPLLRIEDSNLRELIDNCCGMVQEVFSYFKLPASVMVTLQKEGGNIKITIADRGQGIPKQDVEHIFERFYAVDKANSQMMGALKY